MRKIFTVLGISTTLLMSAQVALPYYDGFAYSGTALQTQTGWTAANTGDDIAIVSGNLSYSGLPASTGNKISFAGAGIDANLATASQSTGTVYYSLLLNPASMAGVTDANGGYLATFIQTGTTTTFGATLWTKRVDDTTLQFGIEVRTATGVSTTWTTTNYSVNQTYFIVVGYTFNTGTTSDDVVKLWVNPTTGGTTEPTPTITDTHTGTDLTGIAAFQLRQDSATETPSVEIDELRIGTTWAQVAPSSGSLAVSDFGREKSLFVKNTFVKNNEIVFGANAKDVKVFNMFGQVVKTVSVKADGTLNVADLAKGNYIVTGTVNNEAVSQKILKD
ncbi:T9SS type A sorting domain-containing protein [Chryseobacterium gwangjuense]|uniref:T9SS type A sorting domain-containing protein n=1 Tax=Chryseobacterium gwangjuense TaxID=1069980 RepID=UPI001E58499A|nr:T9SS type A sorting domain-containing protein [Chryseobacterium gwangjuense]MCE3076725.1 T9SS type A sorting domain-containing protein [Chryseobacterium gwangjuense]